MHDIVKFATIVYCIAYNTSGNANAKSKSWKKRLQFTVAAKPAVYRCCSCELASIDLQIYPENIYTVHVDTVLQVQR